MKIGARVLKTGLAIALATYLSMLLIPDNSAALAGIAAVTTTMPSVRKSFDMFYRRVFANIIGGLVGVFMLYAIGSNPVAIGIAAIVTIAVLNALDLSDVLSLAVITVVAVMLTQSDNYLFTATYRVLETIIGVLVSFIINWLVYPPQHDKPFYSTLVNLTNEVLIFIRATLRKNVTFSILHRDIQWARSEFDTLNTLFDLMNNEVIFSKSERMVKARRLVIYRQMIKTTECVVDLLNVLHSNDHVFQNFPVDIRILVRERVETLMVGHEQILLKFSGRVSATEVNFINPQKDFQQEFMKRFFDQAWDELDSDESYDNDSYGVIHIMSAIYYYEESLLKLNNILRIYKERYTEYHEEDEQLGDEHF